MRVSTAYFAGAGTVLAAIVGGVGGGLLIADMISPKSPKQGTETTRLERRMAAEPIPVATAPSEPVPYLAAPQPPASGTTVAAAPAQPPAEHPSANSAPAVAPPVAAAATPQPATAAATPSVVAAAQPAAAREQAAAPEDAQARARDTDVKRVVEKRRFERHQRWAERRRQRQHQEQELRTVEEKVREETEPRQEFAAEPVKIEMPRIRLFGEE